MKNALIAILLAGGLTCFAAERPAKNSDDVSKDDSSHVSSFERMALRTQSPTVKLSHRHHKDKPVARVVTDKHTVNAYIPYGK